MKGMIMLRSIAMLAVVAVLAAAVTAQRPVLASGTNVVKKELQMKLDEWHKAGKFPGATFGVVLANGDTFGLAVGYADRDAMTPMRPTDRMPAGSTGKTFAAALAMQLIGEGKLDLDDRIEKFFGKETWFARISNAKEINVRQLMNHTSGLVRYEFKKEFTDFLTANPYKVWTPEDRLAYLFDAPAPFEAGKGWEYSDTNYIVLGMIIERLTGKDFYRDAEERFVRKLKLADTIPQTGPVMKGVVQGYAGPNNPFGGKDKMIENGKFIVNPQLEWTGGGWASTGHDLARWAKVLFEGKAFDAKLVPTMLDGVPARLGPNAKYGLGVIIRPTAAGMSYGHSGFFPGYMTDMMYFPEHKIAIAVQVNTSVPQDLGKPLARLLPELAQTVTGKGPDLPSDGAS
ncbi:MAG TPA: serine hydrolase domain-containing protein [Pyrinomonadaceae bacterium]|nr:serine hydrolase domain-containing protein [Pyrinomonadaceae bacterium]